VGIPKFWPPIVKEKWHRAMARLPDGGQSTSLLNREGVAMAAASQVAEGG
jgi:hypothetical protein